VIRTCVPRVAVVRLPGMNCEEETARALAAAGLSAAFRGWDEPPAALEGYDAYVLPGGFSYQDRVRAGAVAAKDPRIEVIAEAAGRGVPVLGICNGAQILVESGLVPGSGTIEVALAVNRLPERSGYYSNWVTLEVRGRTPWTEAYAPGERVPLPMAHGEGRFTARDRALLPELSARGQVPFAYATAEGAPAHAGAVPWPDNPNGAEANAAGLTNARGNVLALMPHPERADRLFHVPLDWAGPWGERRRRARGDARAMQAAGPGHGLFLSLAWSLGVRAAPGLEVA
jgi:phosphoribosylformylglycinamidine synthase subunit PurQ / glutaminase